MSVGWINRTPTIFGICPVLELYHAIVDGGLSIQRSDADCDGSAVELALFKPEWKSTRNFAHFRLNARFYARVLRAHSA